ncbi:hypothetical protein PRIPAC_86937, partial [Pristionchus pacificus]
MRSRAQPASSCERTANAKTSSTNTAVYGNEFGPFGGDMRSRAQPASSCERTANAKTSSTNTAVYGNEFGPFGGDMRSRAQPASSCERTANAKTSSTNTAVYGNEFGPFGGDMRSRAQPASSCERTANSIRKVILAQHQYSIPYRSSTNTAVYGNEMGPVGGDMRSRVYPTSCVERTARDLSEVNTAKTSKSNQEIDKLLNSIISEVTALNEGDIQCNDEMRTAADRDNSLSQVHPSLLTQTPLSDCKAASALLLEHVLVSEEWAHDTNSSSAILQ